MIYIGCAISEYLKVGPLNVSALVASNPASGRFASSFFRGKWGARASAVDFFRAIRTASRGILIFF